MTVGTCCRALLLCWRLSVSDMADVALNALHCFMGISSL